MTPEDLLTRIEQLIAPLDDAHKAMVALLQIERDNNTKEDESETDKAIRIQQAVIEDIQTGIQQIKRSEEPAEPDAIRAD